MTESSLITLQERMVNLVDQLAIPLVELSLVISRFNGLVLGRLMSLAEENSETLPPRITQQWKVEEQVQSSEFEFDLDRVVDVIDEERMDILTTLIRVSVEELRITLFDLMILLRSWEQMLKVRLAKVTSPGQLFSPVSMPEGF
ncbi:MAG: hypothetical protein ACKVJ7_02955 [Candidatus Poseidoniales archaeon]|jgi:hypothetical protein